MKVRIKENLLDVIDEFFEGKEGHRTDEKFLKLCERISGKVVDVHLINGDAFEVIDDDFWLPDCCFSRIERTQSEIVQKLNEVKG